MNYQMNVRRVAIVVAALTVLAGAAHAQTPAGPRAVGVNILHLNVTNLDTSLALYRDVLGMEVTTPPREPRANPGLVNEPGAVMRTVILKVPGGPFSMELVEFSGTPLRPVQPRIQDPGEIMLAVNVRDLDAKLAGAKKLGLRVLSKDGVPFVSEGRGGRNRAVMLSDPDGFIVELVEGGNAPAGAAPGPIASVAVYVSVQDLAQTVTFYNRVFGFSIPAPAEAGPTPERITALFGDTSLATVRMARGTFPGSEFVINFQEFKGPDRKPARHRVQDPGGPILLVTVQEFPAVMDLVRANGGIVGLGETSQTLAPDVRTSWIRDPNGVLIRVSQPAPRTPGARP